MKSRISPWISWCGENWFWKRRFMTCPKRYGPSWKWTKRVIDRPFNRSLKYSGRSSYETSACLSCAGESLLALKTARPCTDRLYRTLVDILDRHIEGTVKPH